MLEIKKKEVEDLMKKWKEVDKVLGPASGCCLCGKEEFEASDQIWDFLVKLRDNL